MPIAESPFPFQGRGAGGGGGGSVNSVSAGNTSITIGGTAADPTVALAATIRNRPAFDSGAATSPFTVAGSSQGVLVAHLNADLLDGLDSTAFALASHVHSAADVTSGTLALARGGNNASLAATGPGLLSQASNGANVSLASVTAPLSLSGGALTTSMTTSRLIGRTTASTGVMEEITVGSGLSLSAGALGVAAPTFVAESDGATVTITASAFPAGQLGYATVTIAGNRTLAFSGGTAGQKIELIVKQDGTGSRTLTADSSVEFSADIADLTGISGTAAKETHILFEYRSTTSKWRPLSINKGF